MRIRQLLPLLQVNPATPSKMFVVLHLGNCNRMQFGTVINKDENKHHS